MIANQREYLPVSVKGVVLSDERAVLLKNERDEWELPGGRPEPGEGPQDCLRREIQDELAVRVAVGPLLKVEVYEVVPGGHVLIVAYGCVAEHAGNMKLSDEHSAIGLFDAGNIVAGGIPRVYADAIRTWSDHPSRKP